MKVKPLIGIPSPRDIPSFKEVMDKIPHDKIWAKYMHEPFAYAMIRNAFLESKEREGYTHLVIHPDDLIPTVEAYQYLVSDLEKENYPVLCAICNVDWQKRDQYIIEREQLGYWNRFVNEGNLHEVMTKEGPIIKIKAGHFACYFIRKDLIWTYSFHTDGNMFTSCAVDTQFDKDCEEKNIPIHCDLRAMMLHRSNVFGDMNFEEFYLGRKSPTAIYEKWNGDNMK